MSAEDPNPADDEAADLPGDPGGESAEGASEWPEFDEQALKGKLYMIGHGASVAVTASKGLISDRGAPSDLFGKLTDTVGTTLREVGNMLGLPFVLGAAPTNSMTIVFGEPASNADQAALPIRTTVQSGEYINNLIEIEDEQELLSQARMLGRGTSSYVELLRLVRDQGIDLKWHVAGRPPRTLTNDRAGEQFRYLTAPPRELKRELHLDGRLYRAIWEGPGEGRVGLKLSRRSPKPPRRRGGNVVLVFEESREIEDLVMHQLLGKFVIARVQVTEFDIATNILNDKPPYARILEIEETTTIQAFDLMENAYGYVYDEDDELQDDELS